MVEFPRAPPDSPRGLEASVPSQSSHDSILGGSEARVPSQSLHLLHREAWRQLRLHSLRIIASGRLGGTFAFAVFVSSTLGGLEAHVPSQSFHPLRYTLRYTFVRIGRKMVEPGCVHNSVAHSSASNREPCDKPEWLKANSLGETYNF